MSDLQDKINKTLESIELDGIQKVVVACTIFKEEEILLLQREANDFMGGLIELPSGTVDGGEKLLDALHREVLEETGLTISNIDRLIGTFDYLSGSGKKTRQVSFLVEANTDQNIVLNPEEHSKFYYVNPSSQKFDTLNISNETKIIILNSVKMR